MERSVLLLYMSPFGKNPNIHTQTNEAAVLELKKHKEGPDCILALDKTVAEFLGVSKAAVSQRRKTWQQRLMQMQAEQEEV